MPDQDMASMVWTDLNKQIEDIKARVDTLEKRTERSETTSGHPNSLTAAAPLSGQGAKMGDELWLSDGRKSGEAAGAGTGVLAFYDPATNAWIPLGIFPRRWHTFHLTSAVLSGSAIALGAITAGQIHVHFALQNPSVNGDTFTQSFVLAKGIYTFTAIGFTNADGGLLDWYLDNTLIASGDDFYSGAPVSNVIYTHTVTVQSNGYHVLKGVVNGKNGASTNFVIRITTLAFIPSAD